MTDETATPAAGVTPAAATVDNVKPKLWTEITGRYRSEKGFAGAAKKTFDEIGHGVSFSSTATAGERAVAFGRIGAVGVGAYIAASALRSKDAEGNDRSGLARIGQAVLGTGMAAGALVAGR
jgi:hypothetical protein